MQEIHGVEESDGILLYALHRTSFQSCMKEKKLHLSRQNVEARLEFGRKY